MSRLLDGRLIYFVWLDLQQILFVTAGLVTSGKQSRENPVPNITSFMASTRDNAT